MMNLSATRTRTVARANRGAGKATKGTKRAPAKKSSVSKSSGKSDFDFSEIFSPTNYYKNAQSGKATSKERAVGYKGTGEKGSAPAIDAQGAKARQGGVVYRFANKYGGNIDEYAPIWTPETRAANGDTYEAGPLGLAAWFAGFAALLLVGAYSIYSTSALAL